MLHYEKIRCVIKNIARAIEGALIILCLFFSSSILADTYNATIKEGQAAAQEFLDKQAASAISITLVDKDQIIWSQTFGLADPIGGQALTDTTMFGIGSVSKNIAAIAVMKLVDQGIIELDTPLVTYLPSFKMASPEYEKITVRMLLNHSAGFPGTDYRNALVRTPFPEYYNQVFQTLSKSRLKAPPGYMSVYCNDCYTMIETLIKAKSGKSYAQFVQDEILNPLNMKNTRYPTNQPFPPDSSYVKAIKNGLVKPLEFMNGLATGGAYSTSNDMAQIARMFLGGGVIDSTRILSEASVAKMAIDQTAHSFIPVHSNSWSFGLGWDSVLQPGLKAVGFDGWAKGGDSDDYAAMLMVSQKAGLGIVVIGASGFRSEQAKVIAERVLLRALVENGKIASFPSPLSASAPQGYPLTKVHSDFKKVIGEYGSSSLILRFLQRPQGSLLASLRTIAGWTPIGEPMKAIAEGWFANEPLIAFKVVTANLLGKPTQYLLKRSPGGYGHYLDSYVLAEKLHKKPHKLSAAWRTRLPLIWLVVNENPDELTWDDMDPRLRLTTIPELKGLIAIRPPALPNQMHILNPTSDTEATMMLIIPQLEGRDLDDLVFIKHKGMEWARFGSYMHMPLASVTQLPYGKKESITIGPEGYSEWRSIKHSINPVQITLTTTGSWRLFDATFKSLASGKGNGVASLPAGSGLAYLTVFGDAGQTITIDSLETHFQNKIIR